MFRKTLLTTAVTAIAAAGVATAADAPVVSEQKFIVGEAPVSIPGTGIAKGEYMGARGQLVFRDVTLEGDQKVRLTLRARNGRTVQGLAVPEGTKVDFQPVDRPYAGHRKVVVRAAVSSAAGDDEVTGRIYALTR